MEFVSRPRLHGRTKYRIGRLLQFAVFGVLSFSKTPLRIASILGVLLAGCGGSYGAYAVAVWCIVGHQPQGYPSLLVAVLLIGGLQLSVLGVIGEYLGVMFDEVKRRPLYIVDEVLISPSPPGHVDPRTQYHLRLPPS